MSKPLNFSLVILAISLASFLGCQQMTHSESTQEMKNQTSHSRKVIHEGGRVYLADVPRPKESCSTLSVQAAARSACSSVGVHRRRTRVSVSIL